MVRWFVDRSFMVNPLSYFSFQPVLHDRCNNGHKCYPVCGMVHIKESLIVAHVAAVGFLFCWVVFTICLTPYNHKYNVLSMSLNKTFPSFHPAMWKQLIRSPLHLSHTPPSILNLYQEEEQFVNRKKLFRWIGKTSIQNYTKLFVHAVNPNLEQYTERSKINST